MITERSVEVPFVLERIKDKDVLEIGGAECEHAYEMMVRAKSLTIIDFRAMPYREGIRQIREDIRRPQLWT